MMGLDPARLRQELAGCTLGHQLIVLPTTGSTQDEGRRLARAGAPFGTVVIAAEQTAGRGRMDRPWWSPAGRGLWFTVLLDSSSSGGLLPVVAGVAVAEALRGLAGDAIRVRWPNDVLLSGRKVAGILVEVDAGPPRAVALLGIGVNVNVPPELARPPEVGRPGSLHEVAGAQPALEPVFGRIISMLDKWLAPAHRGSAAVQRWRELSSTLGTRVRVLLPGEVLEGLAEDIDGAGALRIRCDDGTYRRVVAGDVLRA